MSVVIQLPTLKHKWMEEENRMLWKHNFESDKKVREQMERMHRLQIEGGGRETMLLKVKADDLNLQH